MFGKNALNSLASCAASVLLWAMTSVGFCTFSMTLAIVYVLPVPVAPKRTCACWPFSTPAASSSMACGWSPIGSNGATTSNGLSSSKCIVLSFGTMAMRFPSHILTIN